MAGLHCHINSCLQQLGSPGLFLGFFLCVFTHSCVLLCKLMPFSKVKTSCYVREDHNEFNANIFFLIKCLRISYQTDEIVVQISSSHDSKFHFLPERNLQTLVQIIVPICLCPETSGPYVSWMVYDTHCQKQFPIVKPFCLCIILATPLSSFPKQSRPDFLGYAD